MGDYDIQSMIRKIGEKMKLFKNCCETLEILSMLLIKVVFSSNFITYYTSHS